MGADVWRERFGRDQLDGSLQQGFEEVRERKETINVLFSRPELHQQVHVTLGARFPARDGAEEREPAHTESEDPRRGALQALDGLLSGQRRPLHSSNLYVQHGENQPGRAQHLN